MNKSDKPLSSERRSAKPSKPEVVVATCIHCSKEFRIPKSRSQGKDRRRFCSIACANRVSAMLQQEQSAKAKKAPKEIKLLPKTKFPRTAQELTALRRALDINQRSFWARVGVTQSGGSRYEQGRPLPAPVAQLLDTVYVKGVTLGRLEPNDFAILEYLKSEHPDLYASLDKAARAMDKVLY